MRIASFFRPANIIGTLPVTLANGTTADATQVMSDLNWIVNQVNANAAPLANTALTNANNNFTVVQSGIAASAAANFPIASQVQNSAFNTLTSTLGTNTITARVAVLPLTAYASGQMFTFTPAQTNTGPANITIDSAGSGIVFSSGRTLIGGEMTAGVPIGAVQDGVKFHLTRGALGRVQEFLGSGTYTPTTGMRWIKVTVVAGGGGSGGCAGTAGNTVASSGSGGGGGASIRFLTAAQVGSSQAVVVGNGGTAGSAGNSSGTAGNTSSFGAFLSATGGGAGQGSAAGGTTSSPGGAGGTGSSGDINVSGSAGGPSVSYFTGAFTVGGCGGSSILGGGGLGGNSSQGSAGGNFGGGAGATTIFASTSATAGAAGAQGVVIVEEFF